MGELTPDRIEDMRRNGASPYGVSDLLAEVGSLRATVARLTTAAGDLVQALTLDYESIRGEPARSPHRRRVVRLHAAIPYVHEQLVALRAALDATTAPEPARTPLWEGKTLHIWAAHNLPDQSHVPNLKVPPGTGVAVYTTGPAPRQAGTDPDTEAAG